MLALPGLVKGKARAPGAIGPANFAPGLLGFSLDVQGLMVDFAPGAPFPFGLANGARLVVGS